MIATRAKEETDPTTVCRLEIDNQVSGERGRLWVFKPFTEVCEIIMAQMVYINPETDSLEWIQDDEAAFGSVVHVPLNRREPIVIRHYATRGRKAALRAMKRLMRQFPK